MSEDFPAQLTEFRVGSVLAGYRLEQQVGRGGFAVVFRALDERLGRPVALKILSPVLASSSPEFRRRFIAESRAAAAVDDPHIIPVYEAGEVGGVLFIAMRYVAGGDLRQVLEREGALAPDRAADFVSPVASALDAAHSAGLVHRDVKPGNILVDARAGRPDHVYLSDFGIVKGAALGSLTGAGSSNLGTPDYMAPEQISGRPVDGRTDQYSLACVTVQLLTGSAPFQRDSVPALIYAHLSTPPPSLASLRPDLSPAVDQVVAKAMAKAAEKRYDSCGDFADALRAALGLTPYHRRTPVAAPAPPHRLPPGARDPATPSPAGSLPASTSPGSVEAPPPRTVQTPAAAVPGRTSVDPPPGLEAAEPVAEPGQPAGQPPVREGAPPPDRPRGPVVAWVNRHRLPVLALICAILAAAVTIPLISSSPSSPGRPGSAGPPAASTGYVSLGNLSQTPSPVDVYLYQSGSPSPQFVQHGLAYGTILPYRAVKAGGYDVKMRATGSPASSTPVWSVSLIVKAGGTYTVVPLRTSAQQGQLKVIDNNLTAPKGKSFVRVIQAALNQQKVTFHCSCAAGAPGNITTDAAPGTVSPQVPIPSGTWTMSATSPAKTTSLPVTLTAGTVHTEIVIDAPGGGIQIINLTDAAGARQAPTGGASAGTSVSYRQVPVGLPAAWRFVPIASLAFSPSGTTLAIASEQVCLWTVAAARCTGTFGNASITAIAFSPDGKTLAASDNSGNTYLRDVATGSQTAPVTDSASDGAFSVAFSPDGKILAAGDGNGRTYLWNAATGRPVTSLADSGSKGVNSVAFSPDGKILAAGDGNGRTYLWNVTTRKPVTGLIDPGGSGVISVAFSPDDATMAAGDNNGRTYLWDFAAGKLVTTLPALSNVEINSVTFSADGKELATGNQDGRVFLWFAS